MFKTDIREFADFHPRDFRQKIFVGGKPNFPPECRLSNNMNERLTIVAISWKNRGKFCIKGSHWACLFMKISQHAHFQKGAYYPASTILNKENPLNVEWIMSMIVYYRSGQNNESKVRLK